MSYFVYILRCSDTTLYTGIAKDVSKRLLGDNESDKGAKYTKIRRPVELVYTEEASDKSSASKREHTIKKLSRAQKQELIESTDHHIA